MDVTRIIQPVGHVLVFLFLSPSSLCVDVSSLLPSNPRADASSFSPSNPCVGVSSLSPGNPYADVSSLSPSNACVGAFSVSHNNPCVGASSLYPVTLCACVSSLYPLIHVLVSPLCIPSLQCPSMRQRIIFHKPFISIIVAFSNHHNNVQSEKITWVIFPSMPLAIT